MKKLAFLLVIAIGTFLFEGCEKEGIHPFSASVANSPIIDSVNTVTMELVLADSLNTLNNNYEIVIQFKQGCHYQYVVNEDAPFFQGSGAVSLYSLAPPLVLQNKNDTSLVRQAIGCFSDTLNKRPVQLGYELKLKSTYMFSITTLENLPTGVAIWLHDSLKNDSARIDETHHYDFISDATGTFNQRFSLTFSKSH